MKLIEVKQITSKLSLSPLNLPFRPVITGIGIGTVLAVLNMFVFFKTGLGFGGSALVAIGALAILKQVHALNWRNAFITFSVASSGYFATAALDSGLLAVYLRTGTLPKWGTVFLLSEGSNVLGVFLGYMISSFFVHKWKLPYPTLKPAISVLESIEKPVPNLKYLLWSTGGSLTFVIIKNFIPDLLMLRIPGTPSFMSLEISPMLFGLGILIRQKAALWMFAGALYGAVVWLLQDGSPGSTFSMHMTGSWIMGAGVFIIAGTSAATLVKSRKMFAGFIGRCFVLIQRNRKLWVVVGGTFGVFLVIYGIIAGLNGILTIAGVLIVLAVSAMYFNQSGGQIGIAPLNPILFLSILILFFMHLQLNLIILTAATTACLACSSLYFSYSLKVAEGHEEIQKREILWSQLIGSSAGAIVAVVFIFLIAYQGHPGTDRMPVPTAASINYFMESIQNGFVYSGEMSGIIWGSLALGFLLTFTPAAPVSLGIGILLSPGSVTSIAVGGLVYFLIKKYKRDSPGKSLDALDKIAMGFIIGEGLSDLFVLIQQVMV
ncbi:OPT/YSL family transporter [Paenibacillus beijingensis]|uniref:Peptide transporter n=1 Tax=Paenibacillus beijingensis TaxID=1126833 RepID=A0A0D5NQ34_9BACL|nr:OPT/YSL family transporter [Paenibacillus beijingensis]AJY77366.1 hypothetical protein VN24_25930 [Paenibacillus beijingensis]